MRVRSRHRQLARPAQGPNGRRRRRTGIRPRVLGSARPTPARARDAPPEPPRALPGRRGGALPGRRRGGRGRDGRPRGVVRPGDQRRAVAGGPRARRDAAPLLRTTHDRRGRGVRLVLRPPTPALRRRTDLQSWYPPANVDDAALDARPQRDRAVRDAQAADGPRARPHPHDGRGHALLRHVPRGLLPAARPAARRAGVAGRARCHDAERPGDRGRVPRHRLRRPDGRARPRRRAGTGLPRSARPEGALRRLALDHALPIGLLDRRADLLGRVAPPRVAAGVGRVLARRRRGRRLLGRSPARARACSCCCSCSPS